MLLRWLIFYITFICKILILLLISIRKFSYLSSDRIWSPLFFSLGLIWNGIEEREEIIITQTFPFNFSKTFGQYYIQKRTLLGQMLLILE